MSVELKIETYLKKLVLPHGEDLIEEIFLFLEQEINTENAIGNEERIAKLFCRAVESLRQDIMPKDDIKKAILDAFKNIRTIENNTHNNGELMCMYLLNLLYSEDLLEEIPQSDFVLLLDNLEKICCIFKITDINGNLVFPIGKFLFRLVNSDNLLAEIEKASSVQALMLALQVFDKSQYPQELKDIENMIDGKNLKFIEYLCNRCIRLGEEDWKENYEKNGLLILYDATNSKVLIRNSKSSYFKSKYDTSNYNLSSVMEEKNANDEAIAYFVEYYLFGEVDFVDFGKVFSVENNIGCISQILDIIYYYRNYNVIFEKALYERDKTIYPTNPFGENDSYVIDEGTAFKNGKNHISNKLFKYGLLKIWGSGLNYINLGAILKLEEIFAIQFKDFKIDRKSNLNDVVECWLEFCNDKKKCFDEFFKVYIEQINYIFDKSKLFEKKYEKEYLIPIAIKKELLQKLELDEKLQMYQPDKYNLKIDYLQDKNIITDSNGVKLDDFRIEDIAGEDVNIPEGDFYAFVNNSKKIIYIGTQVKYYYLMLEKINQINSAVVNKTDIEKIKETDINNIAKFMSCFRDAFNDCHPGLPIESVARYRILNHMMLLDTSDVDVDEWLELIKKHQILDYSVVKTESPLEKTEGVLYVPKDRSCRQSTLKYINDRYFISPITRNSVDIYDQIIEKKGNSYYTGGKKIERVVLLFDNIQNGKSTKETIDKYIKVNGATSNDTIITFKCDGNVIALSEILNSNQCKIEIFSIYAAETGIKNVKEHVKKQYPKMNIKVLDPIKKLTKVVDKEDMELIKKLYPGKLAGEINEGKYLVVREYNQPKLNIMCNKLLEIERVVALFCKRAELR